MTALDVVRHIGVIPMSVEKPCTVPSGSELRRWLDQKSVVINGLTPKAHEEVTFPIQQLIFFPNGKRRTTVL